ncbi:MAG: SseB family protein, partial [Micromonosporaceae bacterium]|nr:SseB family protein [Micromonosporaceae bacterium]
PPDPATARADPSPSLRPPATGQPAGQPAAPGFEPANEVEQDLLAAATDGQTDSFLSTLLLAKVLVPLAPGAAASVGPGEPGFVWRREEMDGQPYVIVFTSPQRLADHLGATADAVTTKFIQLIRVWPEEGWSFAVNPGTPVGATLPGGQIRALAAWAAEVGLTDEPSVEFETPAPAQSQSTDPTQSKDPAQSTEPTQSAAPSPAPDPAPAQPTSAEVEVGMQKSLSAGQVPYFLERGYDRVSGFVHRASEVAHLTTPEQLYTALGLGYEGSPFKPSDDEMYVLRWTAYRPDLYRIPYGGRDEDGMRAMQGWMIERPPFRGNGFAPGETTDVIAEFKVDSVRLPHGAQMWRLTREGKETLIALFDSDEPRWVNVSPDAERERG